MPKSDASKYTQTYTTFSGCDIVATFGNKVIGELQAITYSISREKAPVYTMGSAEPRSFSRGKRGIAGTMVFTVFDRDALINALVTSETKVRRIKNTNPETPLRIEDWDREMSELVDSESLASEEYPEKFINENATPQYSDEIPPFDVTISFANEYGQKAVLVIYGVELLNEGTGFSIDSVTTEKACTFVARRVEAMHSVGEVTVSEDS